MIDTPQGLNRNEMTRTYTRVKRELNRACFGSTYIKIGTIQRRLAWPLRKDDTQIREAFQILPLISYHMGRVGDLLAFLAHAHKGHKQKRLENESKANSMRN